jgi:hypothetical protein
VKDFMLAYLEAIHDLKRNKEDALGVLKKYAHNGDREVREDATPVSHAKDADPDQFVSYKIAREIEASGFVKRLYEHDGRESK